MKYLKLSILAASLGMCVLATGCATVTGGTTQSVSVKTQKDSTEVAGANCVLTNSGGSYKVVTPGKVAVHREKDDLTVQCTKDGETSQVAKVESSYRKGAIAGDIAWLGVLSVVSYGIDRASGSVFTYPDDVLVTFGEPSGNVPAIATPASASSASTAPADSAQVQTTADTSKTQ
jgi:hypothetical protein